MSEIIDIPTVLIVLIIYSMILWFICEALNRHMDALFYLYSSLLSIFTLFLEGAGGKTTKNKTTNQKTPHNQHN